MKKFSHISHGLGDHATGHAGSDLARNGAPKRVTPVEYHSGMSCQQTDAAGIGGMAHPVTGSAAASPLAHAYSSEPDLKRGKGVPIHPSHSLGAEKDNAIHELGRAILREAVLSK
jgi:hypothetical protein